jgi:hypothetical protein
MRRFNSKHLSGVGSLASLLLIVATTAQLVPAQLLPVAGASRTQSVSAAELRARAWKAYQAYKSGNVSFKNALINDLMEAEPFHDATSGSDEYAYVQSVLDALIQLDVVVPPEVVLPFRKERRAEVLLLLARAPGSENALLSMIDEPLNTAEWLAVGNVLSEQRSQRFFRKTLSELVLTHDFQVSNSNHGWVGRCGGAIGSGTTQRRFPKGFPPIALYQLDFPQMSQSVPNDEILAFSGPHDVYFRRKVIQPGAQEEWTELNFFRYLDGYRSQYLARLAGRPDDEVFNALFPASVIRWTDAQAFKNDVALALNNQSGKIRELVFEMERQGLNGVRGLRLSISPAITDKAVGSRTIAVRPAD